MLNLSFLILVELAVSFGHRRILGLRVENHPSIDFKALNGTTALAYAVNYKQKEMAEILIKSGADVSSTCTNLKTPLQSPPCYDSTGCPRSNLAERIGYNFTRVDF